MSNKIDGADLVKCFEVVQRAGREIDALIDTIDNDVRSGLDAHQKYAQAGATPGRIRDRNDWGSSMLAYSFPIKRITSRSKNPNGWLSYQITLQGEEYFTGWDKPEPLLHVCFWDYPLDKDQNFMSLQLLNPETWRVDHESLIVWHDDAGSTEAWTFSLRLVDINSSEDVEKQTVKPAMALLDDDSKAEDILSSLKGLVRYRKEGDRLIIIN